MRHPEVEVQLIGEDGNAFAILGQVTRALREAEVPADEIESFTAEATAGDYNPASTSKSRGMGASSASSSRIRPLRIAASR